MRGFCGGFYWPITVAWARMAVALSMAGEAWHLAFTTNPVSIAIGHGSLWAIAFLTGSLCILLTMVLKPSPCRAVIGAIPIAVQLSRSWETWHQLDVPWTSGGVSVRVALAAMMTTSLGWSADTRKEAADRLMAQRR